MFSVILMRLLYYRYNEHVGQMLFRLFRWNVTIQTHQGHFHKTMNLFHTDLDQLVYE